MLERDQYQDACQKYMPNHSENSFWKSVKEQKNIPLLKTSQTRYFKSMESFYLKKLAASSSLSLLAALYYKRLPILRDNVELIIRIPLTLMILIMPQFYVIKDHQKKILNSMQEIYQEREGSYKKYLQTGDIEYLKEEQQ